MMRRATLILAITAIALLIACGNTDEFYTVEIVDGVRNVHNIKPLWGDEPKVELEFVQKIGGLDVTDENFIMFKISDVDRDGEGNIYVLDTGNIRVQKFDRDGIFLRTIGGEGDGPGEFRMPVSLNIDMEGRLYIGDRRKYQFIILNDTGIEIRRFRYESIIPRTRLLPEKGMIIAGNYQGTINKEDFAGIAETGYLSLFHIINLDGEIIYRFGEMNTLESGPVVYFYGNAPFEIDSSGNIFIAHRFVNKIEKRNSDGKILLEIDRPLNFPETEFRMENGIDMFPNTISTGIGIDREERIWVVTAVEQPDEWTDEWEISKITVNKQFGVFEIFDRNGVFLGSLPLPADTYLARIFDGRIFIVDPDQVSVSEYKIIEK